MAASAAWGVHRLPDDEPDFAASRWRGVADTQASSPAYYDPFWHGHRSAYAEYDQTLADATVTAAYNDRGDTVVAAKIASTHGKLHKRGVSKPSMQSRKNSLQSPALPLELEMTPSHTPPLPFDPTLTDDICYNTQSPSSRSKFKQNLRKMTCPTELDNDQLDLSKTLAENEERTGLGISAQSSDPWNTHDLSRSSSAAKARGHSRSFSHHSQHSVGSFRPTAPFAPAFMIGAPPSIAQSATASFDNPDGMYDYYAEEQDNDETPPEPGISRRVTMNSHESSDQSRPSLSINNSQASSRYTSETSYAPSKTRSRTPSYPKLGRSSTNQSGDVHSSKSRNSLDRARSIMSFNGSQPVDSTQRAASIQAARQAFAEREDAKAKKYEEQERRSLERQARRQHPVKRRRASEVQFVRQRQSSWSRNRRASAPTPRETEEEVTIGHEYSQLSPVPSHALPTIVKSPITPSSPSYQRTPKVTRKRAAKSRYFKVLTWLKTRVLNMSRSRREEQESA